MTVASHRLVVATHNIHKLKEIAVILQIPGLRLLSMQDFPDIPPIPETGTTFRENALLKARAVHQATGLLTLSDDSGLEVDYLGGAPGVYSARYAGEERDYAANNRKLLEALREIPDQKRGARFRCVVAIIDSGFEQLAEGIVRGSITRELRGSGGFGYDPLFVPEGYRQTFAEMGAETKNRISHRAIAFRKAGQIVAQVISSSQKLDRTED